MKKYLSITFAILLVLSALSACSGEPALPDPTPPVTDTAEPVTKPLTGDPESGISVSFTENTQTITEAGSVIMSTTSLVPTVTIAEREDVASIIEDKLAELLTVSEDAMSDYHSSALAHYLSLGEERESWVNYDCSYSAETVRADDRVISVSYIISSFTGGIHSNYAQYGVSFDSQTGEVLTIDKLTDDSQTLRDVVAKSVVRDAASYSDNSLVGVEDFAAGVLDTNQWYLGETGLTVFASPYEISSYSEGVITFTVPYAELSGILLDSWLPVQ